MSSLQGDGMLYVSSILSDSAGSFGLCDGGKGNDITMQVATISTDGINFFNNFKICYSPFKSFWQPCSL